jgi:hypothetical protein
MISTTKLVQTKNVRAGAVGQPALINGKQRAAHSSGTLNAINQIRSSSSFVKNNITRQGSKVLKPLNQA